MHFYLMDDSSVNYRERFAVDSYELAEEKMRNYSGYYIAEEREFASQEEADDYCRKYNSYEGEPDVHCTCCASGCNMTAFGHAHWNGECAYAGEGEDSPLMNKNCTPKLDASIFTFEDFCNSPDLLIPLMSKGIDYKVWFKENFPNGASSKDEVLNKMNKIS